MLHLLLSTTARRLYVADSQNARVQKLPLDGSGAGFSSALPELRHPCALAWLRGGNGESNGNCSNGERSNGGRLFVSDAVARCAGRGSAQRRPEPPSCLRLALWEAQWRVQKVGQTADGRCGCAELFSELTLYATAPVLLFANAWLYSGRPRERVKSPPCGLSSAQACACCVATSFSLSSVLY